MHRSFIRVLVLLVSFHLHQQVNLGYGGVVDAAWFGHTTGATYDLLNSILSLLLVVNDRSFLCISSQLN
jgi:hypothetical protein